jgi:hypothetical protein
MCPSPSNIGSLSIIGITNSFGFSPAIFTDEVDLCRFTWRSCKDILDTTSHAPT